MSVLVICSAESRRERPNAGGVDYLVHTWNTACKVVLDVQREQTATECSIEY